MLSEGEVDVGGAAVRYSQEGQGPALIHLQASRHRTPAHGLLAHGFRVIVLELPAAGRGPDAIATVARAIAKLGVDDFDLMATAGASAAALGLALHEPAHVRALVLESPTLLRADGADGHAGDLEGRLGEVAAPTLVLFGTRDRSDAQDTGRRYARRMPNAHLVFVYDTGDAIGVDRPEAFAEVVADFLERHEAFVVNRAPTVIHP
jgi:pimeloyl-ACP methyl ester carboxylesterase